MHTHISTCTQALSQTYRWICIFFYCTFAYLCVDVARKALPLHILFADYMSPALLCPKHVVSSACVGALRAACATVHALNVDPTPVSRRTRHKVCHHPVTMAPNLAETRRRQGAPCHRGNTSGMLPPLQPTPEKYTERYMHTGPCEGLFGGQKIFCVK